MSKHYKNEVGTDLILDTGVDLISITSNFIYYKKPDGVTTGTWASALYNSYSALASATGTYLLKYTLASGNLNQSGEWRFQAFVASTSGTWWGEMVKVNIYDQYE
jgi:hypothetical protein